MTDTKPPEEIQVETFRYEDGYMRVLALPGSPSYGEVVRTDKYIRADVVEERYANLCFQQTALIREHLDLLHVDLRDLAEHVKIKFEQLTKEALQSGVTLEDLKEDMQEEE